MKKTIEKKVTIEFSEKEENAIEQVSNVIEGILGIMVEENADLFLLTEFDVKTDYEYDKITKIRDFLELLLTSQNEVI